MSSACYYSLPFNYSNSISCYLSSTLTPQFTLLSIFAAYSREISSVSGGEWRCWQIRARKSRFRCAPSSESSSLSCSGSSSPKSSSRRSAEARRLRKTAGMGTVTTWLRRRKASTNRASSLSAPRSRPLSLRVSVVLDLEIWSFSQFEWLMCLHVFVVSVRV